MEGYQQIIVINIGRLGVKDARDDEDVYVCVLVAGRDRPNWYAEHDPSMSFVSFNGA